MLATTLAQSAQAAADPSQLAAAMHATIDGGLGGVFYTGIAPHEWHGRNPRAQPGEEANALISDALRRTLAEPAPAEFRLDLPVTQGRRMPTVNIESNAALEEYLDHVEQRRAVS